MLLAVFSPQRQASGVTYQLAASRTADQLGADEQAATAMDAHPTSMLKSHGIEENTLTATVGSDQRVISGGVRFSAGLSP